jgi:hypothetical protein
MFENSPATLENQQRRVLRLSVLGKVVINMGQLVHVAPLFICSVALFVFHPSFYSFLIIPACAVATIIGVGLTTLLDGWIETTEVYYDYCLRFAGCCVEEYRIADYIGEEAYKNANMVDMYLGTRTPGSSGFVERIFTTSRNKYPELDTPTTLATYIASKPFMPYIFLRDNPTRVRTAVGKYKVLHEVGHANLDSQYLATPLSTGLYPYAWVVLFAAINIPLRSFEFVAAIGLFGLFIWVVARPLVRQLNQEKWLLEECYADRFAIANLSHEEAVEVFERHIRSGRYKESGISELFNEIRADRFEIALNRVQSTGLGEHLQSAGLIKSYFSASLMIIPLVSIGIVGAEITFVHLLLNLAAFVLLPLGLLRLLLAAAKRTIHSVDVVIEKMKNCELALHDPWLDFVSPVLRLLRPL